jgi:ketosteroid isomerase-like protein
MTHDETLSLMQRHAAAWNAHDSEALLGLMTSDCIYDASAGKSATGERYVGHKALKPAFEAIWTTFKDARWDDTEHFVCGAQGFTTWTFRGTKVDGSTVEVKGLDLLRFRDGKICHKDTYRKTVVA